MTESLFLLDVSGFLYRAYYAIRPMTAPTGESTHALFGFIRSLYKLKGQYPHAHFVAIFDGPDNARSRKALYPEYKAHRTKAPPDLYPQIEEARRFCRLSGIPLLSIDGVEADDTIASVVKIAEKKEMHTFVVTTDKDLAQIVSEKTSLLNPFKENRILNPAGVTEEYGIPPSEVIDYFSLLGDSSDNIPGVSGIGEKGARDLILRFHSLEKLYLGLDELPPKKRELLLQGKENAFLSRKLFTLNREIEIDPSLLQKEIAPPTDDLRAFFHEKGFLSLAKELPADVKAKKAANIILSENQLLELTTQLSTIHECVFDTETTSERPMEALLVGVSLSWENNCSAYLPMNGPLDKESLLNWLSELFERKEILFIAHNGKYDLHVLQNAKVAIPALGFDTIVASYLLHAHERRHNLDHLALEYLHLTKTPIEELIGKGKKAITMADVPMARVADYSIQDAEATLALKALFEKDIRDNGLDKLFHEVEMPLLPILFAMEEKGIYIDLNRLEVVKHEVAADQHLLEEEIYLLVAERFNLNSPKQLSEILYQKLAIHPPKKTETGFSTDAETLEKIRDRHPVIEKILQYRTLEKLRSTYLEKLPEEVHPKTGRIHPNFNQTQTATGRLSCQDPNLQNIPARSPVGLKIREAFRPKEEDYCFISLDYSQIELRLMAHLSEDPAMIEAFIQGKDIHTATAAEIFGISEPFVTKELRSRAKAVNFGILYGQSEYGLAQEVGISRKEAGQFIEHYFSRFPKVRDYVTNCKERAHREKQAVTMTGRRRLLPEIDSRNPSIRQQAERLAVNTPLQGSAADLIKVAMIEVDRFLKKSFFKASLLLQIHDELLLELPQTEAEDCGQALRTIMENVWTLKVPLIVDLHIGKNWKEC